MSLVRRWWVLGLAFVLLAQDAPFRAQTQVVQVPVGVTDKGGRSVNNLVAADFTVLDNGDPQKVTLDDVTAAAPISLAIVIQSSGISKPVLPRLRKIGGMIQPLVTGAQGRVAVVTFDSRIHWVQDFISDDDKIRSAFKNLSVGLDLQESRLLDAVVVVAGHLEHRQGRKILLLISESRDRGSETKIGQALEAVERGGIEVFAAHYSAFASNVFSKSKDLPDLSAPPEFPDDPSEAPNPPPTVNFMAIFSELARKGKANATQALSQATGGADYPFLKERGIESAIERLGEDVHSQYILSFPQHGGAEGLHALEVSVPNHPDLRIRSRRGYWAQ